MKLKYFPVVILFFLLALTPVVYAAEGVETGVFTPTLTAEMGENETPFSDLPEGAEPIVPFLDGYSPEKLFTLAIGAVIGITQGLWPGMSLLNLVKKWLKLADFRAHLVIMAFTVLLAAASLWLLGYFEFGDVGLTLDMLLPLAYAVYAMSQTGYQWFKGTKKPLIAG